MKTCPINAFDCPYFSSEEFTCALDDPMAECDDYYAYMGDDEE